MFTYLSVALWFLYFFLFFLVWIFLPTHRRCSRLPVVPDNSHWHTHTHSVWLLCTRDRTAAGTSTWQHITLTRTNKHAPGEIRTSNLSKESGHSPSFKAVRPTGSAFWFFLYINPSCVTTASRGPKIHQFYSYLYWFVLHFPTRNNRGRHNLITKFLHILSNNVHGLTFCFTVVSNNKSR